jgi:DNA gyrase subunit A
MQDTPGKEVQTVNIEQEMRSSYLDYAMSVIIGRALPEVRDGFKPVHRRILYAMYKEGLLASKRYSKCAGVVGEVLKKYHPHGDSAVYDSLVRMAQEWNMRYPLIDGQGNFGSVDGDSAAAYRYTECRLTKMAEEMMADIEKETVNFAPNYDGSVMEPVVLPTKIPNLLINGSDGIAVGMATKIPPHNLSEIVNGLIALIDDPETPIDDLIRLIPGPDFPTAGAIYGGRNLVHAYKSGRGKIQIRAKAEIEPIGKGSDREAIIVTEIPFQTNKAKIIEHIAELVRDAKIEGISDLRDESDRDGMRMVIELKKGTIANVILNQLYKHTALQTSFGMIMLTIVDGQPKVLNLKQMLQLFLKHRKEVVIRRTLYDLREAEKRAHILEGLKIAVENIDEVVALIKASKSPDEARTGLMTRFALSEIQAQAVLDMRLQRLTGLERDKIIAEYREVLALIAKLKEILASEKLIFGIIRGELTEVRSKYGDARRTELVDQALDDIDIEDMIQEEDMVVTVSHLGYVKRTPADAYRTQKRGGKGSQGMATREEDFVERLFSASTHDTILIFTTWGKVFWQRVYEIPEGGRATRGKAINNLIRLGSNEKVAAILPVKKFTDEEYVLFVTKGGTVKKTALSAYANQRDNGIIAISLKDDELVQVRVTNGKQDVIVSTAEGQAIRFSEDDVRPMGRSAAGVRGISLGKDDFVVSMDVVDLGKNILTVSERGYGKRTDLEEYRKQGRGGSGIITMKTTDKTGRVITATQVDDGNDLMLITDKGKIIRQKVREISLIGRNTQGVRLFNVDPDEKVVSATLIDASAVEDVSEAEGLAGPAEGGDAGGGGETL